VTTTLSWWSDEARTLGLASDALNIDQNTMEGGRCFGFSVGHWLAAPMDFSGSGRYGMGSRGGGKTVSRRVFALQVGVAFEKSPNTFCGFNPRPPREGSTSPSATDEAPGGGLPPDLHDDELRGQVPALLDG
jgi:hypothetical protein